MVSLNVLLEYETLFSEPSKPLKEYFHGAKRERILKLGAFLLSYKPKNNIEILSLIFGKENNTFANEIYVRIKEAGQRLGAEPIIFHPYSSLKLFEFFFKECEDNASVPDQSSVELERNLFTAYLVINSQFTKDQSVYGPSIKHLKGNLQIPMMIFCMSYAYSDKSNYDIKFIWVTQTIKAIQLFQFLESDKRTSALFNRFLEYFRITNWKDYMVKYIPLTLSILKKERDTYTDLEIKNDEFFNQTCDFLEHFIIYDGELPEEQDFLTLRSKPLYKIEAGRYRFIYDLFVVEKIYKGLYFVLRDLNDKLVKGAKVNEFKSFYGKEFSEGILTYKAIDAIYSEECIKYTGTEMDKIMDAAPDYYVRDKNSILIFESKDFLIPTQIRQSFDFTLYETAFKERLYFRNEDGKIHRKAVLQLINSIRNVLAYTFKPDANYDIEAVAIYPVIVVHDHQFDTGGLRELIQDWFKYELDLLYADGLSTDKVKELVIVNIDALIYFQVPLRKCVSLHQVIDAYLEYTSLNSDMAFNSQMEMQNYRLSKIVPFSVFLNNYFVERNLRILPPILEELGLQLFK